MAVSKKRKKKAGQNRQRSTKARVVSKMLQASVRWAKKNPELAAVMRERLCVHRFIQRIQESLQNQTEGKYDDLCLRIKEQMDLITKKQISSILPPEFILSVTYNFDVELNRIIGINSHHIVTLVAALQQMIYEMQERVPEGQREPWLTLESLLAEVLAEYDSVVNEFEESIDQIIDGMTRYLWNEEWVKKTDMSQPTVYLVKDRFLVAARSRKEVKECVRQAIGLVVKSSQITGLPLGYKFEGGITVASLIADCSIIPKWIGRLGEEAVEE